MKLNQVASRLAVICICLLSSLSATAYALTPPDEPMSGTYLLNEPEVAVKRVHDAIEEAVRGMFPYAKGKARNKLRKKNFPPSPQITISFASAQVTIGSAFGSVQTPLNGEPVSKEIDKEKVDVRTIAIGEKTLQRIYTTEQGDRVNTYTLSGDGKTLTMAVTIKSERLSRPCVYELRYTRK
jgi:hypothetical protein